MQRSLCTTVRARRLVAVLAAPLLCIALAGGAWAGAPAVARPDLSTSALPVAQVGVPYSDQLTDGGIVGVWSAVAGTLPAGLSLSSAGLLSGTPTAGGTFAPRLSLLPTLGAALPLPYSLFVSPPSLVAAPTSLPAATVGDPFSQQLTETGGTAPYTWAVESGSLPAGLTLTPSGLLSGTPTTSSAAASFVVSAVDSSTGTGPYTGLQSYQLPVSASSISLSPLSLPSAVGEVPYSQLLSVVGGVGSPTFSSTGLPSGLSLNSATGLLSGTPTAPGSFPVTVTASELGGLLTVTTDYLMHVTSPITLSPLVVPAAVVGKAYSEPLTAAGGASPYAYSVTAGSLPAGLSLDPSTGVIAGTPTADGASPFTVTATDANTFTAVQTYLLTVLPSSLVPISPSVLPDAAIGHAYTQQLTVTPAGAYTFVLNAGALPAGLALTPTGALSGVPTAAGVFGFVVEAKIAGAVVGWRPYDLTVAPRTTMSGPVAVPDGQLVSLRGSGLPGATVTLYAAFPGRSYVPVGKSTVNSAGRFSFAPRITRTETFVAYSSDSISQLLLVGTTPTLTRRSYTARTHKLTLAGLARPGAVVTLYRALPHHGYQLIGRATANRTTGAYSFTVAQRSATADYRSAANGLRSRVLVIR